jgi:hypothetical protein
MRVLQLRVRIQANAHPNYSYYRAQALHGMILTVESRNTTPRSITLFDERPRFIPNYLQVSPIPTKGDFHA